MEGWACVEKDGIEVMFALPNRTLPSTSRSLPALSTSRQIEVNSLWENLKDKVKVVYPIENFDYGIREFAVLHINRYCLQFGKALELRRARLEVNASP